MKKYKVGFTAGVFDMFHIGHLNLLARAKDMCNILIVGVNSDCLVEEYKHKTPIIPQIDRLKIVSSIRYVDYAVITETLDKVDAWKKFKFDVVFIGSDWKGTPRWLNTEKELSQFGVKVEYLQYTEKTSSTALRKIMEKK